jgi:microcystin degradation protein MlrC
MKIVIGSVMHESNTFAPTVTDIEVFKRTQYLAGYDIIKYHLNQRSEIGGVLHILNRKGVTVIPTISAWAMPYGIVDGKTYSLLKDSLISGIKEHIRELDGVLLCLHGSMTVEEIEDAEGDLLRDIRAILPPGKCLTATLDHHANVSETMVNAADFFVGYRTHPHIDQFEVGCEAAELTVALIEEKPVLTKSFIKLPLITPAENRSDPIKELASEIKRIEDDPGVFTGSFFVGYPWADVSINGASVLVVTRDDPDLAQKYAGDLAEKMWQLRNDFKFHIYSIEEAVEIGKKTPEKPIVLDELCDCTLGGSSGDVVTSLRYLVEKGVKNSIAVGIVDAESVNIAFKAGVGATVHLKIGGKILKEENPPLDFEGRVTKTGQNISGKGNVHAGYETLIGKVAVIEKDGIEIVLIEKPGKIDGPSFLEELGINPKEKDFIISKEGLNPLLTYKGVASKILMVDSPGFDRQNLRSGDYKNLTRPIYPLDEDITWRAYS